MADRGILFSAPMVRALLAGRKTQTRRILNPQPETFLVGGAECEVSAVQVDGEARPRVATGRVLTRQTLPHAVGDRLWVRETWAKVGDAEDDVHACPDLRVHAYYRADAACPEHQPWRPSIFMPRWASRITLIVEDVRVERLQDISEADVLADGAPLDPDHRDTTADGSNPHMCIGEHPWVSQSPRLWYHRLWDSLNGAGAWDANPWIVAVTFQVIKNNIDRLPDLSGSGISSARAA